MNFRSINSKTVAPPEDFLQLDLNDDVTMPKEKIHLTPAELKGLKLIIMYLHHIPAGKRNVPTILKNPIALILVRVLIRQLTVQEANLFVCKFTLLLG